MDLMCDIQISCHKLSKKFGDFVALDGVDIGVRKSTTVSLIGPSGSGKSTLLRCIAHLEDPDDGIVMIGREIMGYRLINGRLVPRKGPELARQRQKVGMVFQSFNLFRHLSVIENITIGPLVVARKRKEVAEVEALELLEKVGLSSKSHSYPDELSGGQQQRVAIARSVAMRPDVILMDEPTSALDPELVGEVLDVIRTLSQQGVTLVIATHEIEFAQDVSDQVIFMDGGRIVERGPPSEILINPQNPRTRLFLSKVLDRNQV